MQALLFKDVWVGGSRCDVRVHDGIIARIADGGLEAGPGEELVEGGRLSPPLAEPHVHLDAALLGARAPNRSGTLREGISNWSRLREQLTADDVKARARQTVELYKSWGCLRIRSHVDTGSLLAVEALVELREELRAEGVELQLVAFPQESIGRAVHNGAQWEDAVALGCDAVGAIPHFERTHGEGSASVRKAFEVADRFDKMVDLHCDETDDPGSRHLEYVCAETMDRQWAGRVIAGHCTALHSYPNPHAAKVIELVAESGVQVVCNPLDNAVLQGRYDGYPKRRGLTRVDELWAAGADVGFGHDSVMDPWYRLGTANMMDAAYMAVHMCQLTSEDQLRRSVRTLWDANHRCFGGPPVIEEGQPARMLWWEQADEIEILRWRPRPRVITPTDPATR